MYSYINSYLSLKTNLTMSIEEIDKTLQKMLRFQRASINDTYDVDELFLNNVDKQQLRKYLGNVYLEICFIVSKLIFF